MALGAVMSSDYVNPFDPDNPSPIHVVKTWTLEDFVGLDTYALGSEKPVAPILIPEPDRESPRYRDAEG